MATCLGISTENNLIKYAKVTTDRDKTKVEAFGIKAYEDLEASLKEVLEETASNNIPICMNLTGEMYNYFSVFSMLKNKDKGLALNAEFELLCDEKGYSYKTLDSRYILTEDYMNKEKQKAIYISVEKADVTSKMQKLQSFKVSNLVPLPIAITNLLQSEKENYAIVNIEEETQVTTVVNDQINDVEVFQIGMKDILKEIKSKENSIQKAYEICKNSTIYTMETTGIQLEENVYLKDIMPVLYKIVTKIKEKFENELISVRKIYLTGSAALINNIDLYFQEYLPTYKCEILAPYFISKTSKKINVKDYIEVNSAIAVAMQGLTEKNADAIFKNTYMKGAHKKIDFNAEVKMPNLKELFSKLKGAGGKEVNLSLKGPVSNGEMQIIRLGVVGFLCMAVFGTASTYFTTETDKKMQEANKVISDTRKEIATIQENTSKVKERTLAYTNRITKLEQLSNQVLENNKYRKAIPILLNRIMSVIPQGVKLTSIENNVDGRITINAEARNYDDLGYFKATLKTKNILKNITSDGSAKLDSIVKVTIEGELP